MCIQSSTGTLHAIDTQHLQDADRPQKLILHTPAEQAWAEEHMDGTGAVQWRPAGPAAVRLLPPGGQAAASCRRAQTPAV